MCAHNEDIEEMDQKKENLIHDSVANTFNK